MVRRFQMVKRILRYVKGTLSHRLHFSYATKSSLIGYSDIDWARCIKTRRSTYGYSIFFGGKQPTISSSSCESEYRAIANTTFEFI